MHISTYHPRSFQQTANSNLELSRIHRFFLQHFEVLEANSSPHLLNEVYTLRYQVYCLENPFEEANRVYRQKERDIFDEHALHILIRHRNTGESIATARLVLPNPSNSRYQLPLELHCTTLRKAALKHLRNSTVYSPAEISRLAISKNAKQQIIDTLPKLIGHIRKLTDNQTYWSRLLHSHLTLELLAAAMKLSYKHGITHWYSLATPALIRVLNRFAFQLTPIHPVIEHRGKRYPCLNNLKILLAHTYQECSEAWNILTSNGALWPDSIHNVLSESEEHGIKPSLSELFFNHSKAPVKSMALS
ncbi:hypothetical conserved protein [Candidatus Nitrosoglobus terrae]|uniref:Hypothetical conserved protein n=1 Tax=Candidatus Nitrosoglobus terrae TaxID=1630141 RepID=A0A1Q2SNC7_9GAMM|nr:PEP-CTERM/exosortase system-associated acyltransferase [Candidatus Nitrosoglobus terrae]BAW80607.1 hypothetical conserved protein [Candidatus Nitrosoglobus terrae]